MLSLSSVSFNVVYRHISAKNIVYVSNRVYVDVAFMQVVFVVHTKPYKHLNLLPAYRQMSLNFLDAYFHLFKFFTYISFSESA